MSSVISQNVDGLHRKSGIPAEKLVEVHGNQNLEICNKCDQHYMRDFKTGKSSHDHKTGRSCEISTCKGELRDSIINFNQALRKDVIDKAFEVGTNADLLISLGSSMRVNPVASIPVIQTM